MTLIPSSNTWTRILTAAVLVMVLLSVVIALPPVASLVMIVAVLLAGAWEWAAFLLQSNTPRHIIFLRSSYVGFVALCLALAILFCSSLPQFEILLRFALIWWLVALAWIIFWPSVRHPIGIGLAGIFSMVPMGVALIYLRFLSGQGAVILVFVLFVIMAADVGGYFAGRSFGRRRLAPQVSPSKTWEGVVGGLALSTLISIIGGTWLQWPLGMLLPLVWLAVIFSIVGDLFESLLKRHSGLKDSGHLLPGHGGVLDRVDSLCAGVPLFVWLLLKVGLLP